MFIYTFGMHYRADNIAIVCVSDMQYSHSVTLDGVSTEVDILDSCRCIVSQHEIVILDRTPKNVLIILNINIEYALTSRR